MYSQIAANKRKTVFLIFFFLLFVGCMGWIFAEYTGQPSITPFVIAGSLVYVLITYFISSKMALALNGAHEIQKRDNVRLWRIVENLAITDGLPMPKVYIIDDPSPNAFATGRDPNHSIVAVTSGLLEMLSDTELEGVIAHELGHVKNYDIRVSLIVFALVAVIGLLADIMFRMTWFRDRDDNNNQVFFFIGLAAAILAPLVALLIQLAISRKREYLADATGALTTRYPEGLASALEKIGKYGKPMKRQNSSTAHLYIANPLKKSSLSGLFSTHPPINDRVNRLRHMETNQ